jgi:hypothetical protein
MESVKEIFFVIKRKTLVFVLEVGETHPSLSLPVSLSLSINREIDR